MNSRTASDLPSLGPPSPLRGYGATSVAMTREFASDGLPGRSSLDRMRAKDGGEGRNRTVDTTIFSRMLYQLSYLATWPAKPES
jgi:hypothetical protein